MGCLQSKDMPGVHEDEVNVQFWSALGVINDLQIKSTHMLFSIVRQAGIETMDKYTRYSMVAQS